MKRLFVTCGIMLSVALILPGCSQPKTETASVSQVSAVVEEDPSTIKGKALKYLEEGEYEKAFDAVETEREGDYIIAENLAIIFGMATKDHMGNPEKFTVNNAYFVIGIPTYDGVSLCHVTVECTANYKEKGYADFWWDEDELKWYVSSFSDTLELNEVAEPTDDMTKEELLLLREKIDENICIELIKQSIEKGAKLPYDAISRVNRMIENDNPGNTAFAHVNPKNLHLDPTTDIYDPNEDLKETFDVVAEDEPKETKQNVMHDAPEIRGSSEATPIHTPEATPTPTPEPTQETKVGGVASGVPRWNGGN